MATKSDAAVRIAQWARSVGGDQIHRIGYAAIESIKAAGGAANDDTLNPEQAHISWLIERMHADGLNKEAQVLCVHYLSPGMNEGQRLHRLRRQGLSISRAAYYIYLDAAHAYMAGALTGAQACAS